MFSPAPSSSSGSSHASGNSTRSVRWGENTLIGFATPVGSNDYLATPDVEQPSTIHSFPRCNLIETPTQQLTPYELKEVVPDITAPLTIKARPLPWSFRIEPKGRDTVTVNDILSTLYHGLQKPVSGEELIQATKRSEATERDQIFKARNTRVEATRDPEASTLRRVDFLKMKTTIIGCTRSSSNPELWYLETEDADASP